ncbi:DNA-binding transcriptional regulator, GntR family [Amycolatopsis xylanica]|uniref:DNA-binding transcriptional regulator, GntR family n=1 Tax=Amycolatopsis xylanica TaxID=589385 RepID=A0A1H3HKN7_9PSEU|nr:GntR family transcriptional regulator [Amycolatopsis xylanica]SDY16116.1 DNA-binding transcriptional regulator, GntR family [Amycolatopsis xylanica]
MSSPQVRKAVRRGLAHEAADKVRDAIFAGEFPPGSPLKEVDLAASLDVSRGSVREGLAILAQEGLIRSEWHRGTTVIELTPADIDEVYSVRAALDSLAARTAQTRADPAALAELDRCVDAMAAELASGNGPRLLALDIAFHDAIYAAAGNGRLTAAWEAIRSQVHLFQLSRITLGTEHYRARVVGEHRELAALIRDGDPEVLSQVAEEHVHSARRTLLEKLTVQVPLTSG